MERRSNKTDKAENIPLPCLAVLLCGETVSMQCGVGEGTHNDWVLSKGWKQPMLLNLYIARAIRRELVACDPDSVVAGTAIDGAIILGQEWHLRLGAALGANHRVHFAWSALSTSTHTGRRVAAGRTAGWATTRLVHQAFLLVELLFTGSEYEVVSAFTALKGFVIEAQLGTSL